MSERESILRQAHEACLRRDYPEAYNLYEALLQMYPDAPQVLLEYGKAVYMKFENLEKALCIFERAFERDSASVEALLWLADVAALGYGPDHAGAVSLYRYPEGPENTLQYPSNWHQETLSRGGIPCGNHFPL